jgi:hypothetical protein
MANDVTTQATQPATLPAGIKFATDEINGRHYTLVKVVDGSEDGEDRIPGNAVQGLRVYATSVNGQLHSGAPVDADATFPVIIGARGYNGVPGPADTEGDAVFLWTDRYGALNVIARVLTARPKVVPTLTNPGAYVAGYQVGALVTFNVSDENGRGGTITGASILDKSATSAIDMRMALFNSAPTITSTDRTARVIAASQKDSADLFATIRFNAADGDDSVMQGTLAGGLASVDYLPSTTTIYGLVYFPGGSAGKTLAAGDIVVRLNVTKN